MRAVIFCEHGGPGVLSYEEAPEPQIGPGEVLVSVGACALNHLDLWVRRGMPGIKIPLPHIGGSDIAGKIAAVGEGVSQFRPGDRVLLAPGLSCGECAECLAGDDNLCRKYTVFGYMVDGGCAEYVKSPAANVFPIPPNLSIEEAAAIPLVFLTAWHMLVRRAQLKPGEHVLILGGSSGVGSAGIQIAKAMGASVIATAGSEQKLAKCMALGADDAILHGGEFSSEVRRLTGKRGAEIVFEHTGKATWEESIPSLATAGRLVTCGATTGYDARLDLRHVYSRSLSILGSYMGRKSDLNLVLDLVGRGLLKPVVDRVMPLAQAAEAHARLENREQFGKIVLQVAG